MKNSSFSPWKPFADEEVDAACNVLLSGKVDYNTGNEGREFEKEFATWCGARYALAMTNGSVALTAALKVLGIGSGDEVVVTPRAFIASVSCVVIVGATPIFADVDPDSENLTVDRLNAFLLTVIVSQLFAAVSRMFGHGGARNNAGVDHDWAWLVIWLYRKIAGGDPLLLFAFGHGLPVRFSLNAGGLP